MIVTIWQKMHMEVGSSKQGLLHLIREGMTFFIWLITYCYGHAFAHTNIFILPGVEYTR